MFIISASPNVGLIANLGPKYSKISQRTRIGSIYSIEVPPAASSLCLLVPFVYKNVPLADKYTRCIIK